MAIEVTDKRNARAWKIVRMMIFGYGSNWRDCMYIIKCDGLHELLAPSNTLEHWASMALDEAEEARIAGDTERQLGWTSILAEILSSGEVTFH